MRVALVLEGGSMRAIYTAGILDHFIDNNIKVDAVFATSAGALFGINYVSKQRGRVLRYNKKYCNDKRYISKSSLFKKGNIVNRDFAYHKVTKELDPFDNDKFKSSGIDFYLSKTNIITGKPSYTKIKDVFLQMEEFIVTSAIPFVSKIVTINPKKYLDESIVDAIPLENA